MMTEQELAAIKARCEAATEGPWEVAWKTDYIWQLDGDGDRYEPIAEADYAEGNHDNNAAFIAHAREDIPALLAEVERLRGERQWISVEDGRPPNKEPVFLATFWGGVFEGLWDAAAGEWYMGTTRMPSITHWMPLPEPPEVTP